MQLSAPHQAPGHISGLLCALGWRISRKIPGDGNEDAPTLVAAAPSSELADPGLQHLVCVEARVFAKQDARQRDDQRLRRVAKR